MSVPECEVVREQIPLHMSEQLTPEEVRGLELHVSTCAACEAELGLAGVLFATRPVPPAGLSGRIQDAVRYDKRSVRRPWWGLTAAAVAALALGIGFAGDDPSFTDPIVPEYAYEMEEQGLWLADDGLVAGAPSLQELTDEALAQLLEELSVGSAGGSA
ncbi:MAG: zf-HC2 domain-containing protein [Longimicrobiales bacterium]|jgi:hypothetical protein